MENILNYSSDSEGNSSSEENMTNEKKIDKNLESFPKPKIMRCANSSEKKYSDFFNFEGHKIDKQKEGDSYNLDQHEQNSASSSSNIEIPTGEFWKDFVPGTSQHEDLNISKRVETEEVKCTLKRRVNETWTTSTDNNISEKRKINSVQPSHSFYTSKEEDSKPIDIQYENISRNLDTKHQLPCEEKRKIFYIHSKIAPYLFSNSTCQKCKKITKSWLTRGGIINRINWNIPNFGHLLLSAGENNDVFIWNIWSTLDPCVTVLKGHKKSVKHAIWSNNGHNILSCSYDRTALLTRVETGVKILTCEHPGFVTASCYNPENPSNFLTGTDNLILLWDSRMKDVPVRSFSHKDKFGQVQDMVFINSQEFFSCSDVDSRDSADRTLMAWDLRSSVVLSNQVYQERYCCSRLKLHPSKQKFLAQSQGGYIAQFSTSRPYKMDKSKRYEGHKNEGYNIGFDISQDGSLVYSGSSQGGLFCYDYRSSHVIGCLSKGKEIITDVACHPVLPALVASSTWSGYLQLAGL